MVNPRILEVGKSQLCLLFSTVYIGEYLSVVSLLTVAAPRAEISLIVRDGEL